jgi:hypothetical protein
MKQLIKKILPAPLLMAIRKLLRNINDNNKQLIFIHIGKCGGASLWKAIQESKIIRSQFLHIKKIHGEKPLILKKAKYLILIRNPVQRAISAFNWRYKLVVEDETQRQRFEGEWSVLKKYKSLNNLAEVLYKDDLLNSEVSKEFQKIHHLKENITFYLSELLLKVTSEQIFCVISNETFSEDVINHLDVTVIEKIHENRKFVDDSKKNLSQKAYNNLKKYLRDDYECIEKLTKLKKSTACEPRILLK